MKILYLSAALIPSERSNSLSIMRVCQAFADAGHTVTLSAMTPTPSAPDPIEYYGLRGGFQVVSNYIRRFYNNPAGRRLLLPGLLMSFRARKLIKAISPDIIYSRLTLAELVMVPGDIPILYEMHSLGPLGKVFYRPLFLWLVRRKNFRRIIVTTNTLAELLHSALPDIEITIARLSADPPVQVEHERVREFRNNVLQGREFEHHVGYTGYLDTIGLRGTDVICQVASLMRNAAFHIVGGAPDIVTHWRRYAKDYNANRNIFFYGYRNPAEMPLFLNCFDVTLAPLQYRPNARAPIGQNMSPLKLPQYMGYGKAIVASDIPAHRETLQHEHTAILVPHDDVAAWAGAIGTLLAEPAKRESLGRNARAVYQQNYTPTIRVRRILDGLTEVSA